MSFQFMMLIKLTSGPVQSQFNTLGHKVGFMHTLVCAMSNNIRKMSKNELEISSKEVQKDFYATFFDKAGCVVVKNVFESELMQKYNTWCENFLETAKDDPNCRHPKVFINCLQAHFQRIEINFTIF